MCFARRNCRELWSSGYGGEADGFPCEDGTVRSAGVLAMAQKLIDLLAKLGREEE